MCDKKEKDADNARDRRRREVMRTTPMKKCDYCNKETDTTFTTSIPIVKQNKYGWFDTIAEEEHTFCEGSICVSQFCWKTFQEGRHKNPHPNEFGWWSIANRYIWETVNPPPYRTEETKRLKYHPPQVVFPAKKEGVKRDRNWYADNPLAIDIVSEQAISEPEEFGS